MFYKLFALFALFAVAFAAPEPKAEPQVLTYSPGIYGAYYGAPGVVAPYAALPYAYNPYLIR